MSNATIVYGPEWTPDGTRGRLRYVENASHGMRIVGAAHDLIRLRHTGWHLDPLGDGDTVHGVVLQLPARHGGPCYVPAVSDPYNDDSYVVDFHALSSDREDTARLADGMAEACAERERDYQAQELGKLRAEELREEAAALRAKHRRTVADIRAIRATVHRSDAPTACLVLRDALRAMRRDIRAALERAAELDHNPYSILGG